MTNNYEFWKSIADAEGKQPYEVIDDFYSDIAAEQDRATKELMNNHSEILKALQEYYSTEYSDTNFLPIRVIRVATASVTFSIKNSTTTFTAIVECNDAKNRTVEYTETQWGGSHMEPPDFESECKVLCEDLHDDLRIESYQEYYDNLHSLQRDFY